MADQKQIIEEIASGLALPVVDLDLESDLQEDLGLSRVEMADLFNHLSTKFNILFNHSELEQIKTLGDLVDLVEDKLLE